ncbi:conserved hypothetical protein, partial [Listeria monocytogenes FSL F2-208]
MRCISCFFLTFRLLDFCAVGAFILKQISKFAQIIMGI